MASLTFVETFAKSHRSRRYGSLCLQEPDFIHLVLSPTSCLHMLHNPWQGSATPGCTLPHSKAYPLETGLEKMHSRVWTSGPTWSVPHPADGHPSLFPLVPSDWGIWASPPESDQDSFPGWLPSVPIDLVSPQEGFSPGPLTLRFKRFPDTWILSITFCVFSGWWNLCAKPLPIGGGY